MTKNPSTNESPALILIGGPKDVGKTSLVASVISQHQDCFTRPISYTTRNKRIGEDNSEYEFTDKDTILAFHKSGLLINLDKVYGEYYGIHKASLDIISAEGKHLLKEIHPDNHHKFKSIGYPVISVLYTYDGDLPDILDRKGIDETAYYQDINYDSFDIVLFRNHFADADSAAEYLYLRIRSLTETKGTFPPPSQIDEYNCTGYNTVADEFSDELRVTTKNFHDLTRPYFESFINDKRTNALVKPKCLEVGPGKGWLFHTFGLSQLDYTGIELSHRMIEGSEEANISVCASVRRLPFKDKCFDFILCSLADPYFYPGALCEIRRVLKCNGHAAFSIPSKEWSRGLRDQKEHDKTSFQMKDGSMVGVYSFTYIQSEIEDLLHISGFECVDCTSIKGASLNNSDIVSRALVDSSNNQNIDLNELNIINFATAMRTDK